jgi:hypothetical protein
MRVSDDRYHRDRVRFDLAMRMIRHSARTCTIRTWTGLSDDRIRRLYREYLVEQCNAPARRHRGKSPRQVEFFLRSPALLAEGEQLASLFSVLGVVHPSQDLPLRVDPVLTVECGEQFCAAYETHLTMHASSQVSFEHASFLLIALRRRDGLSLAWCARCGRLRLRDALAPRETPCIHCTGEAPRFGRRRHRAEAKKDLGAAEAKEAKATVAEEGG